jgi:hypothetical protein
MLILERVEIPLAAAPVEVPPPIFAGSDSISVFLCYAPPPFRDASRDLYIGVFRSRPSGRALDGQLWTLKEGTKTWWHGLGWSRVTCAHLGLMGPVRYFFLYCASRIILPPEKFSRRLSSVRSVKLKKYTKIGVSCSAEL